MQINVVNGRVEIRQENGVLIRVVGYSNAMHAEFNDSKNMLLILSDTGKVEVRNVEGNLISELASGGIIHAAFLSNSIVLSNKKGESKVINYM